MGCGYLRPVLLGQHQSCQRSVPKPVLCLLMETRAGLVVQIDHVPGRIIGELHPVTVGILQKDMPVNPLAGIKRRGQVVVSAENPDLQKSIMRDCLIEGVLLLYKFINYKIEFRTMGRNCQAETNEKLRKAEPGSVDGGPEGW